MHTRVRTCDGHARYVQVAMYYLVMFYEALAEDLKPFRPGA